MTIPLLVLAVLLAAFGISIASSEKKRIRRLRSRIVDEFGKKAEHTLSSEERKRTAYYTQYRLGNECPDNVIDDITWNDLELDTIFDAMNCTYSTAGEDYLYYLLHTPCTDEKIMEAREKVISHFTSAPDDRIKLQLMCALIGKDRKVCLYEYIKKLKTFDKKPDFIMYLPIILLASSVLLSVITPRAGVPAMIGVIFFNIFLYYKRNSAGIQPYLAALEYIERIVVKTGRAGMSLDGELREYGDTIRKSLHTVRRLFKGSFILSKNSAGTSPIDAILDYVRIITHLDIIKFYKIAGGIAERESDINTMIDTIGFLEGMAAAASFRVYLGVWCRPQLYDTAGGQAFLEMSDAYHPMVKEPVVNSITARRGILITGSNASGKSTFLKTAALCALLSQTIHTCPARAYAASFFQIRSSMALRDDLASAESYYIAEIKSLKRILTAVDKIRPMMCLIDEVLRGTNTIERIAASAQILKSLSIPEVLCIAATHDIELTHMLENDYENVHFQEKISDSKVVFDYRLYPGRSESRNAIRLLGMIGYDDEITSNAEKSARVFMESGEWKL